MRTQTLALLLCAVCSSTLGQVRDAAASPPWRRSDTTLIQLCFDGLNSSAPKRLPLLSITENSMGGGHGLDLIGLTLTGRPIYQGSIEHPTKFRSALVRLPNSETWVRIDKPADLEKNIDVWRDAVVSMCTADAQADYKILSGAPVQAISCPDLGVHASLKVTSYSEQALELVHVRANGPKSFNGLRGCMDFVYGPAK